MSLFASHFVNLPFRRLVWLLFFCACGAQARTASIQESLASLPPVPQDAAQIVFLKPSIGFVTWAGILELREDRRQLLGVMGVKARLVTTVAPGKHRFMSYDQGGATHFLDAEVEAGKRYFVLVRFIYGAGNQLRPMRPNGQSDYDMTNPEFAEWLADSSQKPARAAQLRIFRKKDEKVAKAQTLGWERWLRKTDDERAQLTLRPEDGI